MTSAYTAGELIKALTKLPSDTKIVLLDADTGWTIPTFELVFDPDDKEMCIHPCNYEDMIQ